MPKAPVQNPKLNLNQQNNNWTYHPQFIPQQVIPQQVQQPPVQQHRIIRGEQYENVSVPDIFNSLIKDNNIDIENTDPVQIIDDIIATLKQKGNSEPVDYGYPRLGKESIGKMTNYDIVSNCLNKAISVYPGVTYNLVENIYGLYDLTIFYYGQLYDRFMVDPCNKYGKGCPVLYDGKLMTINNIGKPEVSSNTVSIPLGSTLAVRQNIFRRIPSDMPNYLGTTADVYKELLSHLLNPKVYYLVDMVFEPLPDDEDNYKAFGEKILKINDVYPLTARYRLVDYINNDDFSLLSDQLVYGYSATTDDRTPTGIKINVKGNNLIILEPDNNIKEISLEE